jgi:hypothetical protein
VARDEAVGEYNSRKCVQFKHRLPTDVLDKGWLAGMTPPAHGAHDNITGVRVNGI